MDISFPFFYFSIVREVQGVSVFITIFRVDIIRICCIFFIVIYDSVIGAFFHLIDFFIDLFKDMRITLAHCASVNLITLLSVFQSVDHYSYNDQ